MADLNEWALEIEKKRHLCKYCEERHRACQDNYHGSGEPCPRRATACARNEAIKAEERASKALDSVLFVPEDVWRERGVELRNERYRKEGRTK